jgi:hypothetical protein
LGLVGSEGKNLVAPFPYGSPFEKGRYMEIISGSPVSGKGPCAGQAESPNQKCVLDAIKVDKELPSDFLGSPFVPVRNSLFRNKNIKPTHKAVNNEVLTKGL